MTITVSISQFRQNISEYLAQAQLGHTIILKDEKRGSEIAEIVGKKKWNPQAFYRAIDRVAGVFTAERHPEWRTKRKVIRWVEEGRKAADRTF